MGNTVVRLFEPTYNKLVETVLTDRLGRYAFLVGPSEYYVTYTKPGYAEKTVKPVDYRNRTEASALALDVPILEAREEHTGTYDTRTQRNSGTNLREHDAGGVCVLRCVLWRGCGGTCNGDCTGKHCELPGSLVEYYRRTSVGRDGVDFICFLYRNERRYVFVVE